uniref:Uncharacterized protein n=1 Tax=Nelumbo nucifera TaxID=4432 RepID=A0A822Z494_NELNU|nr:TPA_asm: hypothetical protein HUJ06_009132 [Nelumbo nucifera]
MKSGKETSCLIDFWMQEAVKEINAAFEAGESSPPWHTSDIEIGGHIFDFVLAA